MVTLTNTSRRLKVLILPHELYCILLGRCACHTLRGREIRRVPSSLTLPAGTTRRNLPDAVIPVLQQSGAMANGIRMQRQQRPSKTRGADQTAVKTGRKRRR